MRSQSGATIGGTHVGQSTRPHGDTGGKEACARRRARARAPRSSPRRYPGRGGGNQPRPRRWGPLEAPSPRDSGWDPSTACGPGVAAAWVPRSGSSPGPPPALPSQSGPSLAAGPSPSPGGGGGRRGRRGRTWSSGGAGPEPWSRRLRAPSPGGTAPPGGAGSSPPPPIPSQPERERERAWRSAAVCRGTSEETLLRLLQESPIDDDLLCAAGGLGLGGDPGRCEGRPRYPRARQPARAPGNPARGGSFRSETCRGGHRLLVRSAA